jgi:hypothetical protein
MQLTQKHFQFIAKVLSEASSESTWADIVERFAEELANTNPKFKRELFLSACGLEYSSDFELDNQGSVVLVRPLSAKAKDWLLETAPEHAQFFGDALVCEHRYVDDLASVIQNEGMTIH